MTQVTGSTVSQLRSDSALPFSIGVVRTAEDVAELVAVRSDAYLRHRAPGAANLQVAEPQDHADDAILLLARSKVDGAAVGSVRVQTRLRRPLMVESAMTLPADIANARPVELMRGSVRSGALGGMVSAALAKASFLVCKACGFDYIIVTCREPVNLMYRTYHFDELLGGDLVDLHYSPGVGHKVLALSVNQAEARWKENNPRLLAYMTGTTHKDIVIDYDYILQRFAALSAEG